METAQGTPRAPCHLMQSTEIKHSPLSLVGSSQASKINQCIKHCPLLCPQSPFLLYSLHIENSTFCFVSSSPCHVSHLLLYSVSSPTLQCPISYFTVSKPLPYSVPSPTLQCPIPYLTVSRLLPYSVPPPTLQCPIPYLTVSHLLPYSVQFPTFQCPIPYLTVSHPQPHSVPFTVSHLLPYSVPSHALQCPSPT